MKEEQLMIKTTPDCIGRIVLYQPRLGVMVEEGEITHYNDQYVFIRCRDDLQSKATRREDLHWPFK